MTLNIYLVRHGKTEWNIEGRLQGQGDSPLVEEGIIGAKKVGAALAAIEFDVCYSSLMPRAIDTANYIIGERSIPHFHHRGLNELDFGIWEGMKSVDLHQNEEYWQLKKSPKNYQALSNQGETLENLYLRIRQTFQDICRIHQEKQNANILVVSHGMTLTLLTAVLKGLEWYEFRDENRHSFVNNTSITQVRVENGKAEIIRFNQIEHLE